MFTFEIGHKYYDTSACDHNCVFTIEIVKRTTKTVTFRRDGKERRTKLFCDERGEYIIPDRYSMAPVFRAEREVQPEEAPADVAEAPAAPSVENAAPSKVVTISQPADDGTVIIMIGQRVERNCGACFPLESGTVAGFVNVPDGLVVRGGVFALVRWDNSPNHPERVRLSDIHRHGWRSAGGSPLGVFVR